MTKRFSPWRLGPTVNTPRAHAIWKRFDKDVTARIEGTGGRIGPVPHEKRDEILRLRAEGLSQKAIGQALGIAQSTVSKELRRGKANG